MKIPALRMHEPEKHDMMTTVQPNATHNFRPNFEIFLGGMLRKPSYYFWPKPPYVFLIALCLFHLERVLQQLFVRHDSLGRILPCKAIGVLEKLLI